MKKNVKKVLSLILVASLSITCLVPGFSSIFNSVDAAAASYEIVICDESGNEVSEQIKVMESEQTQLSYKLIDCSMPDGATIKWSSDTPLTASVTQEGLVRGHDSSKGAAVRLWLDNDVKTIAIVGPLLASALEKVLFNDNVDLDTMDTEAIVKLVQTSLGSVSGTVATSLTDKLRDRLNNIDTTITVQLVSAEGDVLASDDVHVLVTNSDKWYAAVIPNGAFITNKDTLPTTVAVGGSLTLIGGVTPLRLGYGVTWSLATDSILKKATDYATLGDDGTIKFLKEGTVTVTVSPNADQIVDKLMEYINKAAELGDNVDTGDMAKILVKVLGLDISDSTMKTLLDILVTAAGMGTNYASLISKAVKLLANYLLKASINDKITFTIVDSLQLKSFEISGTTEVTEGDTSQLSLTNVVPAGANSTNIVWSTADESIAYVDENGILIGRDAGGISSLNSKTTTVTASVDGISASIEVTVKGKLITTPVDIAISGPSVLELGATGQYSATLFPSRSKANITWGIVGDDGETISYCSNGGSVSNSIASINSDGILTSTNGGSVKIAAKAGTLATCVRTYTVYIGTLTHGIEIDQGEYLNVKVPLYELYKNASTQLTVSFNPPNASNKNVKWSVLSGNLEVSTDGKVNPSKYEASYGVVQAMSYDGGYKDTIVVSFSNYPVTGISLDKTATDLIVGESTKISAKIDPVGSGVDGAKIGDASIKDCYWSSSDESIATVNGGTVTAIDSGTAVITGTTCDGGFVATCTVTVRPNKERLNYAIDLVNSGKVTENNCPAETWEKLQNAYNEALSIREIEFANQVTCDTAAQNIIDIFDSIGAYVNLYGITLTLNGEDAPTYNSVKVSTSKSYKSYNIRFGYQLIPDNAMYSSIVWSSSNSSVSVNNGVCTPTENKACSSIITITATDYTGHTSSDSAIVTFANTPVTGVSLDKTEISNALVYNTDSLNATVAPEGFGVNGAKIGGASITDVVWYTSDESIVSVDQSGKLNYNSTGTAIITVTTIDGGFSASCNITVSVNKTALAAAITAFESANLVEEEYTVASFNALKNAYAHAVEINNDAEATQASIDAASTALSNAQSSLKKFIKVENAVIKYNDADAPEFISQAVTLLYTSTSIQLDARVTPLDSMVTSVVWSSSTSDIKVDESGKCTPSSNNACYGVITITVTDERGNVVTDSVHVSFARYPVTDVNLSTNNLEVSLDDAPTTLTAECKNVSKLITLNATISKVYWSSDNESILTVDENGKLTYHNAGQATVTATAADGGITATCIVTVCGDKSELRAAIADANAANINIQDHTYDTSTAYQDAYNHAVEVEASVLYSQEEITAAAVALKTAMANLKDYIHMQKLTVYYNGAVSPEFISIKVPTYKTYSSQSVTLTYDFAPANSMYSSIVWSSSNSNISVDNGVVKPKSNKAGGSEITLTATDHYGNVMKNTVYVSFANYPVTGISIDKSDITVNYGAESQTITASLTDDRLIGDASVTDIVWKTSDADVATVDGGVVTFVEAGTCQITAYSLNGGYSASCMVTVLSDNTALRESYSMVKGLNLDESEYTEESWAVLAEAMSEAEIVLANPNPKQRDINSVSEKVLYAYDNLDKYVKIQGVYITYNGSDATDYISQKVSLTSKYTDSSISLGYRINPTNATYDSVEFVSSNSSVAVTSAGVCTPTENNACWSLITLIVTDNKGVAHKDSVYVAFANYQVTGISVSPTSISDAVNGNQSKLSYSLTPKATLGVGAANIQNVTWFSSDETVATVSDGVVTYHNSGEVIVTAKSCDGGYSASTTIKVYANKTALSNIIDVASKLKRTDYTPSSWSAFSEAYEKAIAVKNSSDPTQSQVDAAYNDLNKSTSNLVEYVYVSDISISAGGITDDFINIPVGNEEAYISAYADLSYKVNPSAAMYTSAEWTYDGDIFVNTYSGVVAPKKNLACYGTVKISITDDFGNVYEKSVVVSFTKNPVSGVSLDNNSINCDVNSENFRLNATVIGANGGDADISDVIWTSSEPGVASVDNEGNVDILSGGYTEIKVTSIIGGFSAICKIFVTTDKSALHSLLENVIAANYQKQDYIESSYNNYYNAYNNAVSVYSDNEASQEEIDNAVKTLSDAIASLQKYVHMTGINFYYNGSIAPKFISVNVPMYKSYKNMSVQLTYDYQPSNAMFESITWSSDNSNITVDSNGKVYPNVNKAAAAMITLTAVDYYGNKFEKSVYVAFANFNVTEISISNNTISGLTGGTATLSYTIKPTATLGVGAANIQDVIWSSSNDDIATVNQSGKVIFVDAGECVITVTSKDGGHSASCNVTVTATAEKVALAEAIKSAKEINKNLYTNESYAVLDSSIKTAEKVYDKYLATNTEISGAIDALKNAEKALVYADADYTSVNNAIEQFNLVDKFLYTNESLDTVNKLIADVIYSLKANDQQKVEEMAADINNAIASLELTKETKVEPKEDVGTVVDDADKYVYGIDEGSNDVSDYIRVINGSLEYQNTENGFGTGSVVNVVDTNNEIVDTYKVIIFGDVNGDGIVNGDDSILIWFYIFAGADFYDEYALAADVNKDGVINEEDAALVEQAGALLYSVAQK